MEPDLLGLPYERRTIDLGHDDEGPLVATLVRRRCPQPTRRAVLYVHGFVDYFFQTHLADFFVERGWDFYAIDLHKYGRSLLPHQTPNFCRDISDYFPELDAAADLIRDVDGHDTLVVSGHSTGGLITSLWAHARRDAGVVDGLFLNSPFFDLNAGWLLRRPVSAAACWLGRRTPYRTIRLGVSTAYGESLHAEHRGEWAYDLAWKPLTGFPVRVGWLSAIRRAQEQLRAGLDISAPVLVACSTRSVRKARWHDSVMLADAVLDVEHIARWAPGLGRHVTVARFDGGMHDLTLSAPHVREQVFSEVARWVDAFVAPPGAPTRPPAAPPASAHPVPAQPMDGDRPAVPADGVPANGPATADPAPLTSPAGAAVAPPTAVPDGVTAAPPTAVPDGVTAAPPTAVPDGAAAPPTVAAAAGLAAAGPEAAPAGSERPGRTSSSRRATPADRG